MSKAARAFALTLVLLGGMAAATSCAAAPAVPASSTPPASTPPSPAGNGTPAAHPYPFSTPKPAGATPSPSLTRPAVVPFRLNVPVVEGATQVMGTGPANVPIALVDITMGGTILAQSRTGADGTFDLHVSALEKNHRIGLGLGDLAGSPWSESSFYDPGFNSAGAMLVPQIGFVFDSTLVQAK